MTVETITPKTTAVEAELLMFEYVDGRECRLEWRGPEMWLVVDDRETAVDPVRVFRLLRKHTSRPESEATA